MNAGDLGCHHGAFGLGGVKEHFGKLLGAPHMWVFHQHVMRVTDLRLKVAGNLRMPGIDGLEVLERLGTR